MKRGALKRRPRARIAPDERERRRHWRLAVLRASNGQCVMCADQPLGPAERQGREDLLRRIEAHHVIAQQHLKQRGLDPWNPILGIAACAWHHGQHTSRRQRIPLRLVPQHTQATARALGLMWLLEREHPA